MKAWKAFDDNSIQIIEEVNAKKETLDTDGAAALLKTAEKIYVTSGKKILEYNPSEDFDEMLKKATGRTGNLRAPTLKIGNTFYVGFNVEMYENLVG